MHSHNSECIGNYNFDRIAYFAKRRFIYGYDTIALLAELIATAKTQREKEEIALVSSLTLDDGKIKDLRIRCRYDDQCRTSDCTKKLKKLKKMIEQEHEKSSD